MVMPLILVAVVSLGTNSFWGWRVAMIVPGTALLLAGFPYYALTQDVPGGNYKGLRSQGILPPPPALGFASFLSAAKDSRVWILFVVYGACFGVELTINNIAALYFYDRFGLDVMTASLIAGLYGVTNNFARPLGGLLSDRIAVRRGLGGRVNFLTLTLLLEGCAVIVFAKMDVLWLAILSMLVFSIFVQMSNGATYGIVPFVNHKSLGAVAGIVGAGGNAGAVAAGFLFRAEGVTVEQALTWIGFIVLATSLVSLAVRFSPEVVRAEDQALAEALRERASEVDAIAAAD